MLKQYFKKLFFIVKQSGRARRAPTRIIIILIILTSCSSINSESAPLRAEKLRKEKKYAASISLLEEHIQKRSNVEKKPKWENPYFYELEIGDILLEQNKLTEALKSFESAEAHDVEKGLVADRYRAVAEKLSELGQKKEAIELLKKHQELDPLLFNSSMDQISKEIVQKEEN